MRLEQKRAFNKYQHFELADDHVSVTVRQGSNCRQFNIPICVIAKNPAIYKDRATGLLVTSIILAVGLMPALAIVIMGVSMGNDAMAGGLAPLVLICGIGLPFAVRDYRRKRCDVTVYANAFNGETALVLWNDNPDKKSFEEFRKCLDKQIEEKAATRRDYPGAQSLAAEIEHLHQLLGKGIIDENEFRAAKAKLLGSEGDEWKFH